MPDLTQGPLPYQPRRVLVVFAIYLIAYFAAAWMDLYTTELALQKPGTTEGNVYATNEGGYSSKAAWMITIISAPFIAAFLAWGLIRGHHVSRYCFDHPIRSFGKFYILPWRKRILDRSPLHMASFAIAFPALRVLAAGNNLMIYLIGTGPLGWLVGYFSNRTTPAIGFWLVMGPLFCLLAIGFAPTAGSILKWCLRVPISSWANPG